jgi:hypothetical protein
MNLSPEIVFSLSNGVALLAWLALAASPPGARWTPTVWRCTGRVLPLVFAVVYVALLLGPWPAGGSFNSIEGVQALFASKRALTAGWLHYLAFDLFIGTWMAQRAAALALPHWQVLPLLALTFMFGPAGLLAFFVLRAVHRPQSLAWTGQAKGQARGQAKEQVA